MKTYESLELEERLITVNPDTMLKLGLKINNYCFLDYKEIDGKITVNPSLSLIQKWLRDEKHMVCDVRYCASFQDTYMKYISNLYILKYGYIETERIGVFDDYDDALFACVQKALDILVDNTNNQEKVTNE